MRFAIKAILVLLSGFILSPQPERLLWEADRPLTWGDFRGVPDTLLDYAATTNSGMSHTYALSDAGLLYKSTSEVAAHFYPTFSWYKARDTSATILAHEQLHFDITELHARKLRKAIWDFEFSNNSAAEVDSLYRAIEEERVAMQLQFDQESRHSLDKDGEQSWQVKVKALLQEWSAYEQ